ncbi:MAG: Uma2 family endonuclease [Acidobacteriota bacterium]|nr:MAG: Uma2 family endonuclease [Acidobacteriota bacterium]
MYAPGLSFRNGSYFEHHAMLPNRKTPMATLHKPPDPSVVLENVSWQTYENLLADLADSSAPRLNYDRGVLEIMSPSAEHERLNRTLALLVEVVAEELSIETENLGSATFRREDLERGFEPDSCFYVRNAARIRGKKHLDLGVDPPPDLVIEIDITSSPIDKMSIYAQVGVPELWRYDGTTLQIACLEGEAYVTSSSSAVFPILTVETLRDFLAQSRLSTRLELTKAFRQWIRSR